MVRLAFCWCAERQTDGGTWGADAVESCEKGLEGEKGYVREYMFADASVAAREKSMWTRGGRTCPPLFEPSQKGGRDVEGKATVERMGIAYHGVWASLLASFYDSSFSSAFGAALLDAAERLPIYTLLRYTPCCSNAPLFSSFPQALLTCRCVM